MGHTMSELWRIQLEQHHLDAGEDSFLSDGDEPYLVAIGFRSQFRTPGSTKVLWGGILHDDWADGIDTGGTAAIPADTGVLAFPGVDRPTREQMLAGKMPEIVGALVIAMESDATPSTTCAPRCARSRA